MNILFISKDGLAIDLARQMVSEGCDVKLYIKDKDKRRVFENIVPKVNSWKRELKWVGKEGLIVFDDMGFGKDQDELRKKGYAVVGGSLGGDKIELDREHAHKVFKKYKLQTLPLHDFGNIDAAITFLRKQKKKKAWVVKRNDNESKTASYVGQLEDGSDVLALLESYKKHENFSSSKELIINFFSNALFKSVTASFIVCFVLKPIISLIFLQLT